MSGRVGMGLERAKARALWVAAAVVAVVAVAFLVPGLHHGNDDPEPADDVPAMARTVMGVESFKAMIGRLRPLHQPLGEPEPGDWLYEHDEKGQTFAEYVASKPLVPDEARRTIYIQPLGTFSSAQRKVLHLTAEFVELYFNLPVTTLPVLPLTDIPRDTQRRHPEWGMRQVLTGFVLNDLLRPALPDDAFALIAITTMDLWPGEGWNFVFGQASLRNRVGVWSIYRFGDPELRPIDFQRCLRRTMATASHELGHMFSMHHCTAYECNMEGSNSAEESERKPLGLCPECLAKVCWATKTDPVRRFQALEAFARKHGFTEEADSYAALLRRLSE